MIKLIEKIEGEAKLHFSFKDEKIDFVDIEFLQTRSIEKILEGKNALDALVINPRVCGICGHAHLIATVKALENCYEHLELTNKAKIIRELTLNFELIQNHFKWFYFTVLPLFGYKQAILKATQPSQLMGKAIATIAGQYPHNSYAVVGGVVSDMTQMDKVKVEQYIDETMSLFVKNILDIDTKNMNQYEELKDIQNLSGDLVTIINDIFQNKWEKLGKSYDRFICFGENSFFQRGKSAKTRRYTNIDESDISEFENKNSYAKNVQYKDKYYEVGPLSRAILNKNKLIKNIHEEYEDSILCRIVARVLEISSLLNYSKKLLKELDLSEDSYIEPSIPISQISAKGCASVEAARGSLVHKVELEKGIITKYDIITPTQWNLSNGVKQSLGVSQKAMIGLDNENIAEIVFKSFDVCSVCTTH